MSELNRVCKWRTVFAGRIWGTQPKTPQTKGRTDIFEKLIINRVEISALAQLLIDKGVFTEDEWAAEIELKASLLDAEYEVQFPGLRATDVGMVIDARAVETMKGWPA